MSALGVKRTWRKTNAMSAFDPKQTWATTQNRHATPFSGSRADLTTLALQERIDLGESTRAN